MGAIDRLSYTVHPGEGPYAILIPGTLGTRSNWAPNVAALAKVCRPVVTELWGHGRTPAPKDRGAYELGAPSIGFNITLPHEQKPNAYITADLSFQFHYFAMRKMHLAMRANALVVFPGGFGTLDELFEMLTLQQSQKAPPTPIVLFDRAYWSRIVSFETLAEEGVISREDLDLFEFANTPEEIWTSLIRRGLHSHSRGEGKGEGEFLAV